ncbi:MAG TPA: DUF2064 domain-containing protein [Pseudonocardia sp.]|nr:DUF2064 domain-containing protein [Pseudonocardia sp.]
MSGPPDVLLVLAKSPVAGLAKTRLCPPATPSDAAAIAAAALLDTLDAVGSVPGARVMIAWTGELDRAECADELGRALAGVERFEQCDGPLGRRIAGAHAEVARRAPGAAVLQIGMDTPQLDAAALAAALEPLRRARPVDAVLGPASDGGWWALGLRDPRRAGVIADVPMSRPDTGELTLGALLGAGLGVENLAPLRDVDDAEDARAVATLAPHGRFAVQVRARLRLPAGGPC